MAEESLSSQEVSPQEVSPQEVSPQEDPPQKPPLPLGRRILYLLLALGLSLLALELAAAGLERTVLNTVRTLPTPAPRNVPDAMREFRDTVVADRNRLGFPSLRPNVPIPLENRPQTTSWQLRPNTRSWLYSINSDGLRGDEILPLVPGEVRILTLGDSSIFGDSITQEEIWSTIMAKTLQERWGRPVRIINGAVPGHDTTQSLQVLELVGQKAQPSWVIVGNLWSDVYRGDHQHATEKDEPRYRAREWLKHLALYRTLHILLSPWLETVQVGFMVRQTDLGSIHPNGPPPRVGLSHYLGNLAEIVARATALGARPAFLCLGAPVDLDSAPVPEIIREYRAAMIGVAERLNAPLVYGPKVLNDAGASIGYFIDQVHPAPEGHALFGKAMADALSQVGPPPAGASQYPKAP